MSLEVFLEGKVSPKARPRVTRNGSSYLPKNYKEWRDYADVELRLLFRDKFPRVEFPVETATGIKLEFWGNQQTEADIDNLGGSILDSLTKADILQDDSIKHVRYLNMIWLPEKTQTGVLIQIKPLNQPITLKEIRRLSKKSA
ncbi:MAG: RusA family crossover junction endodeoxyribonuclease [Desertifilum sp.]|nr:RusA family crossover junction endodeoxyribonuclease [Desertifilum sp.]